MHKNYTLYVTQHVDDSNTDDNVSQEMELAQFRNSFAYNAHLGTSYNPQDMPLSSSNTQPILSSVYTRASRAQNNLTLFQSESQSSNTRDLVTNSGSVTESSQHEIAFQSKKRKPSTPSKHQLLKKKLATHKPDLPLPTTHLIRLDDKVTPNAREGWATEQHFTYVADPIFNLEFYLSIGKIAVLPNKPWGVFAGKRIREEAYLGMYQSNIYSQPLDFRLGANRNEHRSLQRVNEDANEVCNTAENSRAKSIQGDERDWRTAVLYTPSSANANIHLVNYKGGLCYKSVKPIEPGELLLVYNKQSNLDILDPNFRFLRSTNGCEESEEIRKANQEFYSATQETLPKYLCDLLKISADQYFIIPDCDDSTPRLTMINLPLLAIDQDGIALPQKKQENITSLMYACAMKDLFLITELLTLQANPNIQTSICGYTALHIVVASQMCLDDKIKIVRQLINNGACVYLKDKSGNTPLDLANELQKEETQLIATLKTALDHQEIKNAWPWTNEDDQAHGADAKFVRPISSKNFLASKSYMAVSSTDCSNNSREDTSPRPI